MQHDAPLEQLQHLNRERIPGRVVHAKCSGTHGTFGSAHNNWPNSVDKDYTQPGNLFRVFDDGHKDRSASRIAGGLGQARKEVKMRMFCHFFRADPDYGARISRKLEPDLFQMTEQMNGAPVPKPVES
jgi:catalase